MQINIGEKRSVNALNEHPPTPSQNLNPPPSSIVAQGLQHCCLQNSKWEIQKGGNLGIIWPSTQICFIVRDTKWLIHYIPMQVITVAVISTNINS